MLPFRGEGDGIGGDELPVADTELVEVEGAGGNIQTIEGGAGHQSDSVVDHG